MAEAERVKIQELEEENKHLKSNVSNLLAEIVEVKDSRDDYRRMYLNFDVSRDRQSFLNEIDELNKKIEYLTIQNCRLELIKEKLLSKICEE